VPPQYVYAFLEVKAKVAPRQADKTYPYGAYALLQHQLSKNIILPVSNDPRFVYNPQSNPTQMVEVYIVDAPSSSRLFDQKLKTEFPKEKEAKAPDKLLVCAEWALEHGLMAEFHKMMDELRVVDSKNAVLLAYDKTKDALAKAKAPKQEEPAAKAVMDELKKDNYRVVSSEQGHYTLLTNCRADQKHNAELKRKLDRLEEVYSTFFYWFALRGQIRPLPPHKLTVVVVETSDDKAKEFLDKREVFNHMPMVGSGFTARRDNVVVVAANRIDQNFTALEDFNRAWQNGLGVDLTKVVNDPIGVAKTNQKAMQNIHVMQMLALCQRAMEEDNNSATLSHEGLRQLIASTGVLPRNVATGEWARFGLASFFETPAQSFHATMGGPNSLHLINYKLHRMYSKKLDIKNAQEVLLNVITDQYFRQAYDDEGQLQKDKGNTILRLKVEEELEMARAASWSLMYYLMKNKSDLLSRYFDELARLPRDCDYDSKVLRECFYRAFGLLMQDPNNKDRQILNVGKLESFASQWMNTMDQVTLNNQPVQEQLELHRVREYKFRQDALKIAKDREEQQKNGGIATQPGPGGPGYNPGVGGPGYNPNPGGPGGPGYNPNPGGPGGPGYNPNPGSPGGPGGPRPGGPGGPGSPGGGSGGVRPGG